ncbi:MAG TPA: cellulase family glycosylhydrolase [Gaiellaceae bacterium]|nr:cellulase family glycosylhydrolase [Gaiellaceae bacterium]
MGAWTACARSCWRPGSRVAALALAAAFAGGCGGGERGDSNRFGISSGGNLEFSSSADLERELDGYRELGVSWIRFDLKWEIVEAEEGVYDWSRYDRIVDEAQARDLRILAVLAYAPGWARPNESDSEIDPDAYAAFAAAAVRRYAPRGVRHYEVWNEPNHPGFWNPEPDPAAYARLVRASYEAMKAADSDVTVLAGSLAPTGGYAEPPECAGGASRVNPIPFLEAMYAEGVQGSFDALSYHPYTGGGRPGDDHPCNGWHQMEGTSPSLRSAMEEAGDAEKEIWATEFGAKVDEVGEEGQAERIAAGLRLWPRYPWAGPLMVYAYRDPENDPFNLVRLDWSRRPAWHAYREAVRASS